MKRILTFACLLASLAIQTNIAFAQQKQAAAQRIDRQAVVRRHTIHITKADSLNSLSVGNGSFAFTADITGLQSFPAYYQGGVPLGTQSEWGWNSFPNVHHYKREEAYRIYHLEGRDISYAVQVKEPERSKLAADYFRINPHRLQLGNIGLQITKKDGSTATMEDIQSIDQQLDCWTGEIKSRFQVEGQPVEVITYAHQQQDIIAVKITSPLMQHQKLQLFIHFPYPTGAFKDVGVNDANSSKHQSLVTTAANQAVFTHALDSITYKVKGYWPAQQAKVTEAAAHHFTITPQTKNNTFQASFLFARDNKVNNQSFEAVSANSRRSWPAFWNSGGAIDFAGSKDSRATELERRVILSQYLTRIQCASDYPPQETGLTYNSWFGKPHLEMYWWHAVHYALWGRTQLMEKSLNWYFKVADQAKAIAKRQGFEGLRWQKMVDHQGEESPSSVGAFLIWQQPHFIYMAELAYRNKHSKAVLNKYKDLLFATADFMASFPAWDSINKRYNLGKGLIPAQECFDAVKTFNPTYELAYWHWALNIAQQWRIRLGMPRKPEWDNILNQLAPLPQANGIYLATESTPDCYTTERYLTDHPAVLGAFASLPRSHNLDTVVMKNTFNLVWKAWKWDDTWGWDFPLTAMAATRLHIPEKAIDALFLPVHTNTYLVNGHNYQDQRLTIYLPGNGGLLSAIALMCTGSDEDQSPNPGFPKDTWNVQWEGLHKMP